MKTTIVILILLLSLQSAFTQDSQLILNLNDGSTEVFNISEIQKITFSNLVNIEEIKNINNVFNSLKQFPNFPNPFSQQTTIKYEISEKGSVRINIYDNKGVVVKKLFSKYQDKGTYTIEWDGRSESNQRVPTGLYFCQIILNNKTDSRQLIYINK